ncbi:hypothetical protein RJ55_06786 [Drechmeria coniospora]|nr:hypothetical protein RJ55_06786 [Drechmeria coniospora]
MVPATTHACDWLPLRWAAFLPIVRLTGCLGVWDSGTLGLWVSGSLGLWLAESLGLWLLFVSGSLGLWVSGCAACFLVQGSHRLRVVMLPPWLSGSLAVLLASLVKVRIAACGHAPHRCLSDRGYRVGNKLHPNGEVGAFRRSSFFRRTRCVLVRVFRTSFSVASSFGRGDDAALLVGAPYSQTRRRGR